MDTVTLDKRLSQPAKEFLHQPSRLLIDGKLVEAASGKTFPVYNPATGAILMQVAEADSADVDRAVKAARKAFDEGPWSKISPSERGKMLWKLAELLEKHSDEFAEIESIDNGKPVAVARAADVPLHGWMGDEDHWFNHPALLPRRVPVLHAARASWRGRTDHPMELPAANGGLEDRASVGGGLHGST